MQLWQLGSLVGFGVALIVYLVHLSGGSRKAVLTTDSAVTDRFADDFPLLKSDWIARTISADAGFLAFADGSTGLVCAIGDRFLTRHLNQTSVKSASVRGSIVSLDFNDFTFPRASFEFGDAAMAATIHQRFSN